MRRIGYAGPVSYVVGSVLDTLPEQAPDVIALARLDTDWYSLTKHELEHLYPRLPAGGVLIIDDYGHWAGSKKATDEYLGVHDPGMMLEAVGYAVRVGIRHYA